MSNESWPDDCWLLDIWQNDFPYIDVALNGLENCTDFFRKCNKSVDGAALCEELGGNATNGTAGVEKEYVWWKLICVVFPLFIVFGNSLVVSSVFKEKSLQTPTNYYIVSLAFADILVAILVMPMAVYVEILNSYWTLGNTMCDIWVACDVMSCTASILNLAAISVDRYTAVTRPIQYAKSKGSHRTHFTLVVCWLLSLSIATPLVFGANNDSKGRRDPHQCTFNNSQFIIFSSIGSFYLPCVVMLILYWRIFSSIRSRAQKKAQKQTPRLPAQPIRPSLLPIERFRRLFHRNHAHHAQPAPRLAKPKAVVVQNEGIQLHTSIYKNILAQSRRSGTHPNSAWGHSDDDDESSDQILMTVATEPMSPRNNQLRRMRATVQINTVVCSIDAPLAPVPNGKPTNHRMETESLDIEKCDTTADPTSDETKPDHSSRPEPTTDAPPPAAAQRQYARKFKSFQRQERKATKTLAIVLVVFLVCWMPFFTANNINAVCLQFDLDQFSSPCDLPSVWMSVFVWLGYMNSFMNPIIYTIFNLEFRKAFKKRLQLSCN